MAKPTYNGIEFDSEDEIQFYQWCVEAKELGVIVHFEEHLKSMLLVPKAKYPTTVQMVTKVKDVDKHLMASLDYTPDFILFSAKGVTFTKPFQDHDPVIDVKPSYDLHKNSSKFSVLQKVIYHLLNIYVHKVEIEKFFMENGAPESLKRWRKKDGKPIGKWHKYGTIQKKCSL